MDNNPRDIDLEKRIDAYIKGRLTQEEADGLWVELLKNPDYMDLLDTELHIKSILEEPKKREENEAQPSSGLLDSTWKWAVAAAFIGVLVVALNLLRGGGEENLQPPGLSTISMADHLASPDIVRTGQSNLTEAESLLKTGFEAALSGQIGQALQTYDRVINNFAGDNRIASQAYFNVGIIRYNSGRFADASASFHLALERIEEDRILEEKARWFLTNSYLQLEEFNRARAEAERVFSMDGIYRNQASDLLNRMSAAGAD